MHESLDPYEDVLAQAERTSPIWCEADGWDEAAIPPRPWLAPGYLARGALTVLVGGPGLSKSMLVLAQAIALALARPLHGFRPVNVFRSLVFNVEDDAQEQRRRLSAALTSIGRTPADIAGLVFRTGPTKLGVLFERDPETGAILPTPALAQLKGIIRDNAIDALFVDPLAELHGEEENDNGAVRSIAAEFRLLAVELNIAVVIVHHTRKGTHTPGDPEASRGASSLIGAARTVLTIVGMLAEEATAFGLGTGAHRAFFRLDGGKANHAALTECEWFERIGYDLANGDRVAAVVPWHPPADTVNLDTRLAIEAAVTLGSPSGPWSTKLSADDRSIRRLLLDHGIVTAAGMKAAIESLLANGFVNAEYRKAGGNRLTAKGLRAPDGRPAVVAWIDRDE